MTDRWIFFAITWAAVFTLGVYERGKIRILLRPSEREIRRVYRAFRRGLQRDWKP
jgi:hypothetical protein